MLCVQANHSVRLTSDLCLNHADYRASTHGIFYAPLWRNNLGGDHTLLKLEARASLPLYRHPGWEQIHIIKGCLQVNAQRLESGVWRSSASGRRRRP
ncbi:cupin domain-containing protein [Brenneria goodwinii]|uniref:cupin domain-containing protein n=1 Tax=Brenneria goodwinii TaxID=1109412 RepID=UPI0036F1C694